MTGVAFAHLVPLTIAKDHLASAAAGEMATVGSVSSPLASLALNKQPAAAAAAVEPSAAMSEEGDAVEEEDLLRTVAVHCNRLNVMRTDMPYAALSGADPPLTRDNVFHVSGLPGGGRVDEIQRLFQSQDLGKPRVTYVGGSYGAGLGALVEVSEDRASLDCSCRRGRVVFSPLHMVVIIMLAGRRCGRRRGDAEADGCAEARTGRRGLGGRRGGCGGRAADAAVGQQRFREGLS